MRSALPKVLHPLCGRPMIAVADRRRAGGRRRAGRRRRRPEAPARRASCPRASSVAVQARAATAPATRCAPPRTHIDAERHRCVVLAGDVPLITAEAIAALVDGPRGRAAPPRRWRRWSSTTRPAYGRVVRDADGSVERVVETKARGRRDARRSSRSARSTPASTRSTAARCSTRSARLDLRQRAGRALPARRAAAPARGRASTSARTSSPTRRSRSASTTASTSPRCARSRRSASTTRHALAGVTIVDPGDARHRRRRRDRPRHGDRAVHVPARRDARSGAAARSARSRR